MSGKLVPAALPAWLAERADGSVICLHVQPGARSAGVVGTHGDALKVRIDSPPVDGKANAALVAYLSSVIGVPRSAITLLSGESGRRKRLLVAGVEAARVIRCLGCAD